MSSEYIIEHGENSISAAINYMEQNIRNVGNVLEYVTAIQENYAGFPNGLADLHRMTKAAQFITYAKNDDFNEEVQSVYHGELLGTELINILHPDSGNQFTGGFAHSYVRRVLEETRPTKISDIETVNVYQDRLRDIARSAQMELGDPDYIGVLNPRYETFGKKLTAKLTQDKTQQELSMMGFRMVLADALMPRIPEIPSVELSRLHELSNKQTGISILRDYMPVDNKFYDRESNSATLPWINISYIRSELMDKFLTIENTETNLVEEEDINMYVEDELIRFNEAHRYINTKDILKATGRQFVVTYDKRHDSTVYSLDHSTEVRGMVDGIILMYAPRKRQLSEYGVNTEGQNIPKKYYSLQPAIRIVHPTFLTSEGEVIDAEESEYACLPLNYDDVEFSRIDPHSLE